MAQHDEGAEDDEDALIDAHTTIAALGLIPELKDILETAAEALSNQWLNEYRGPISSLSDERQEVYRQIRELSAYPLDVYLVRPKAWLQPTNARTTNGTEVSLARYESHMLCDDQGQFPDELNMWEQMVLKTEMDKEGRLAWYRNPARASQDSLGVAYVDGNENRIVRPDFIFFSKQSDGNVVADIVDPHGHHLADALPKLRGLARYAQQHGELYRRIEAVSEVDGQYRVINLKNPGDIDVILKAVSARSAYLESKIGYYAD